MADAAKETPWNSIDLIQAGIFQDSEIIIKSGNANYRMPGYQFAQAFGGLGITEGTCSTAAPTATKKCTLSNYALEILPKVFNITFTNENSYGDTEDSPATYPTLQIYNSNNKLLGSYPVGDSRGHYAGSGCWGAGDTMRFCFANGKFCIQNSDVRQKKSTNTKEYTIYSDGSKGYSVEQVNRALTNYKKIIKQSGDRVVDFNNYTENAFYIEGNTSWATYNAPYRSYVGGNYFSGSFNAIDVTVFDENNLIQIVHVCHSSSIENKSYKRCKYNGTWNSWIEI